MKSTSLNPFFIRAFVQTYYASSDGRNFRVLIPSLSGHSFKLTGEQGVRLEIERLNPFFIRAFVQTDNYQQIVRDKRSLNPFFIRAFVQTPTGMGIMSYVLGLNPFFIRAFVQTQDEAGRWQSTVRLNPFFIRAFVQTPHHDAARSTAWVLIPSLSGHSFKLCFGVITGGAKMRS